MLDERIDDAWQLVHLGLVGRVDFDMLDTAVLGIHRAVADECGLALFDPARLLVGAAHLVGQALVRPPKA